MQRAGSFAWPHRDLFDRTRGLPVVSKDAALDTPGAPEWQRIW